MHRSRRRSARTYADELVCTGGRESPHGLVRDCSLAGGLNRARSVLGVRVHDLAVLVGREGLEVGGEDGSDACERRGGRRRRTACRASGSRAPWPSSPTSWTKTSRVQHANSPPPPRRRSRQPPAAAVSRADHLSASPACPGIDYENLRTVGPRGAAFILQTFDGERGGAESEPTSLR